MSWVMVGMAGAGLLKSEVIDKPQAKRDRELAAKTQALSPWTGMQANPVKEADPFGTALQFGATGAMMNSNLNKSALDAAAADRLNTGGSLMYGGKNIAKMQNKSPYEGLLGADLDFGSKFNLGS